MAVYVDHLRAAMSLPTPFVSDPDFTLYVGDALEVLRELPDESVHCCVTSPPYWGLRDYGTGAWEGGDEACDHTVPLGDGGTEAVDERTAFRTGKQYTHQKVAGNVCRCGATRVDNQLGLEPTPEAYVQKMVEVFREVRRVLRADGTCWINLGSSYASGDTPTSRSRPDAPAYGSGDIAPTDSPDPGSACRDLCDECLADYLNHRGRTPDTTRPLSLDALLLAPTSRDSEPPGSASASLDASPRDVQASTTLQSWLQLRGSCSRCASRVSSLLNVRSSTSDALASSHMSWLNYTARIKPKDMVPIPWMVAMALQTDGWYLRADIIWAKNNPMPESVTDRPTKAHEYVFLLSRSPRYFFDQEAVREALSEATTSDARYVRALAGETPYGDAVGKATGLGRGSRVKFAPERNDGNPHSMYKHPPSPLGRNIRSVWEIATQPYPEAHFATFPEELPRRCIAAGTSERGCCPECGALWTRATDVAYEKSPVHGAGSVVGRHYETGANNFDGAGMSRLNKVVTTTGWSPSCDHNREPVPCTVLDPFMGSGTTALVARKLGRRSIGIELSPEYAALCARRLQQQSLFAETA